MRSSASVRVGVRSRALTGLVEKRREGLLDASAVRSEATLLRLESEAEGGSRALTRSLRPIIRQTPRRWLPKHNARPARPRAWPPSVNGMSDTKGRTGAAAANCVD